MERVRERKAVGMRRTRDILQSPGGPDRGESHEIRTQRICYRYNVFLHLAVLSSPHFSDELFTKGLLNCLVYMVRTAGGDMKTLAMLCFCILCAIDGE